ncbi:MAG TPA: ABC transporter permease [Gemmatimonadaceae bacterium]|jgi:predicted permease
MPNEPRIPGIRRLPRVPGRAVEKDVDDELAFHIESRTRYLVGEGMDAAEARRVAETEFGDLVAARRELAAVDRHRRRRERLTRLVDVVTQDFRHAVRSLGRAPAFTLTAIVTLVAALGSTIAIFGVIDAILIKPLPFRDPDRLVGAWHDMAPISLYHVQQSPGTYFTYRTQAHTIEGIGIYDESAVNVGDERSSIPPERVTSADASASLFTVLGIPAARGRVFNEEEDRAGATAVVVIGDALWRTHFGADASIIGRTLDVNGVRRQIVGVMPPAFRFPTPETQLWIPLQLDPVNPPPTAFGYTGVARLKPNVTLADAQRDFTAVLPRVIELYPKFVPGITQQQIMQQTKPVPVLTPLTRDITGEIAGALWIMGAAAALLFLVAGVNVATLALVRFDARERELAVRAALGAGRARVVSYQFAESLVIALGAGLVGLGLAWSAVDLLVNRGPADIPRLAEIEIGGRVVAFAATITALAAIGFSAIPTLRIITGAVALREGARGGTTNRRQQRLRSALVTAQIALGILVLTASGLLLRSFQALHAVRLGFQPDHVASFWVALPRTRYSTNAEVMRFTQTLLDRVLALPGVRSVGMTSSIPLTPRAFNPNPIYPESDPQWNTKLPPLQHFTSIGGDFLETMGIPLVAGRRFYPGDRQLQNEALISQETAQFFWHDSTSRAALGKRFKALPSDPWTTVVGVVGNLRDTSLAAPPSMKVYFPELVRDDSVRQHITRQLAIAIRTTSVDPGSIITAAERIVQDMDPTLPAFDTRAMTEVVRASTARLAFTTLILCAAALITVILGAVGLYGVLAYLVTLRRRELGIRIALGASPRRVAAAMTRHGLVLAITGAAIGLALLNVASRSIRSFLYGVAPWDPVAVIGSTLVLLVIAAVASWVPARRAAGVDPAEALRAE